MAIAFGSSGTTVSGSGSAPLLHPVAPASGSNFRNFLVVTWKDTGILEPVVTAGSGGWTRVAASNNTPLVATGADVGSCSVVVYYADGTAPTSNNVQFSGTVGCAQANIFNYTKGSNEAFVVSNSVGADNSNGANYSATTLTNFLAVANDVLVSCTSTNSDAGTYSADTLAATGLTLAATAVRVSSRTAVADDNSLLVHSAVVSSGTQSAPASLALTNASSTQGSTLILRLRVQVIPSITVTDVGDFYSTAGYGVSVSGLSGYEYFRVYRGDSTGLPTQDLRGAQYQAVSGDTFATEDYEFKFGYTGLSSPANTLTYHLELWAGGDVVADTTATVDAIDSWQASVAADASPHTEGEVCKNWLSVPDIPSLNMPVVVQDLQEYSISGNILSSSHVLGRKNPVVSLDVSSGRAGSFTLLIPTLLDDFIASYGVSSSVPNHMRLVGSGYVMLLRSFAPWITGIDDFYFVVSDASIKRISRIAGMQAMSDAETAADNSQLGLQAIVTVVVNWIEVDAPPNVDAVSIFSWQTVLDNFTSWQDLYDSKDTWLEVLQNPT